MSSKLKKKYEIDILVRFLTKLKNDNSYDYNEKYMKIIFNLDDNIYLGKAR